MKYLTYPELSIFSLLISKIPLEILVSSYALCNLFGSACIYDILHSCMMYLCCTKVTDQCYKTFETCNTSGCSLNLYKNRIATVTMTEIKKDGFLQKKEREENNFLNIMVAS